MRNSIKPFVALVLTGIGSLLVFGFKTTDTTLTTTAQVPTATTRTQPTTSGTGSKATPSPTQGGTTATANGSTSQFADGTFTGAAIREPWGTFEVQAVISGGQLVDVQLVAAPSDRHSSQINRIAVPMLTESAIANQSANVDLVSGATWTTESYAESLQAALDAAAAKATAQQAAG